jgi:hypothetical protein
LAGSPQCLKGCQGQTKGSRLECAMLYFYAYEVKPLQNDKPVRGMPTLHLLHCTLA